MDAEDVSSPPPPIKSTTSVENRDWTVFKQKFSQVQYLLDHNRLLINEINQNHESRVPESLTRNVALTRELNNNICKVVDLYANISDSFVKAFDNPSDSPRASSSAHEGGASKPIATGQGSKNSRPSLF